MFYQTNRTQAAERAENAVILSVVTLIFDLWPEHSTSSERGIKHVFPVNLAQIRSAVPEIFHTQAKEVTDSAKNRTLRSSLRVVNWTLSSKLAATLRWFTAGVQSASLYDNFRKHGYYVIMTS